jgi:hypothetical protein
MKCTATEPRRFDAAKAVPSFFSVDVVAAHRGCDRCDGLRRCTISIGMDASTYNDATICVASNGSASGHSCGYREHDGPTLQQ